MITLKVDLIGLALDARRKKTNMFRVLFDDYIYKHVERKDFEVCSRGHNNSMVQINDHGLDHVSVRIKTKGAKEKIG